jgi:UPF0755 protein
LTEDPRVTSVEDPQGGFDGQSADAFADDYASTATSDHLGEPPAGRRRGGHRGHRIWVAVGFLALVIAGIAVVSASGLLSGEEAEDPGVVAAGERTVIIPEGLSAQDVAKILERQGIIGSATTFLIEVRLKEAAGSIKPGEYQFTLGQDNDSVIAALVEGPAPVTVKLTIPEGMSVDQVAGRLASEESIDATGYAELAADPASFDVPSLGGQGLQPETLEGLLFPSTYFLAEDTGAETLIQLQLDTLSEKTAGLPWERAEALGVTPYEIVTVASMIEKEARVPEERALVSAVIYNRLAAGMTLGIDATTRYALKKWTEPLTKSDLEVDSPYNTRRVKGLPPGPIASPGLDALRAALEPEEVDYLYYVLQDEEGHHFFTSSYEEFLRAAEQSPGQ